MGSSVVISEGQGSTFDLFIFSEGGMCRHFDIFSEGVFKCYFRGGRDQIPSIGADIK